MNKEIDVKALREILIDFSNKMNHARLEAILYGGPNIIVDRYIKSIKKSEKVLDFITYDL